jgi:hypothetical protein
MVWRCNIHLTKTHHQIIIQKRNYAWRICFKKQKRNYMLSNMSTELCFKSVAESHYVYRWKDKHTHNDKGSQLLDLTIFIINDAPFHVILHIPILIHPHTVKRILFSNACTTNYITFSKPPVYTSFVRKVLKLSL